MFVSCNCEVTGLFCASSVNLFCFHFFPYVMLGASVPIGLENILSKIIRSLVSQKCFYLCLTLRIYFVFLQIQEPRLCFPL